jgi:hypothetical protein
MQIRALQGLAQAGSGLRLARAQRMEVIGSPP